MSSTPVPATFSRGAGSLVVDLSMHKANREAFFEKCQRLSDLGDAFILAGGGEQAMYDSDTVWDFRQESNFQYLFGVKEPGCFGVVGLKTKLSILFIPRLPVEYAQWFGAIKPCEWFKSTYLVDEVFYVDQMSEIISGRTGRSLMYYNFVNLDSGLSLPVPTFPGSEKFKYLVNESLSVAHVLNELRSIKSDSEVAILQYANDVSCRAHIDTMREIFLKTRGSVVGMEHFAETNFRFQSGLGGCARVGYHCIACSGLNNAVLHYGHSAEPNGDQVAPGSLRLLDMGAEYHCYTADVTCTFPTSGTFSSDQAAVYNAVWEAVVAVESRIHPGVDYREMHRLAQTVMMTELKRTTDMFPGSLSELVAGNVCSYFQPHGLGHMLGLAVHDVGGYAPGEAKNTKDLSIKGLRLGRRLEAGMVLTVEPGFYFIDYLIDELAKDSNLSKLINFETVERFKNSVSGVRIEDNVLVTKNGCRVLTDVPRKLEDVQSVMKGDSEWIVGKNYREY